MTCPFCDIVAGRARARRVYEDDNTLAFLDIHPVSPGHCLVISKRHVQWFTDIEPEDGLAGPFLKACYVVARKVKHALNCRYVTMLIRGTRVPHLHMLIVPTLEEDNLLDKTLNLHHFAQERLKPALSESELDEICQRIQKAKP
ncbi:MAG: HIT domain-containing protein [candidate division WOR-3 bacterium]